MSRRGCWTLLAVLTVAGCTSGGDRVVIPSASTPSASPAPTSSALTSSAPATSAPASSASTRETIATGLQVPWGLAFLPDGTALVTLRDQGEVLRVTPSSQSPTPVSVGHVPGVEPGGEGGLLGIAVSPTFASDRSVFVYFTASNDNRVMRMTFDSTTRTPRQI